MERREQWTGVNRQLENVDLTKSLFKTAVATGQWTKSFPKTKETEGTYSGQDCKTNKWEV